MFATAFLPSTPKLRTQGTGIALLLLLSSLAPLGCSNSNAQAQSSQTKQADASTAPTFAVSVPKGKLAAKTAGRLMIIVAPDSKQDDLRGRLDDVEGARNGAAWGMDATFDATGKTFTLKTGTKTVRQFPLDALTKLAPGTYQLQAAFAYNPDLRGVDAPGNLFSPPQTITLPADANKPVALVLSEREPDNKLSADTETLKWIKLRSEKLSKFYKRPIFLYAGVVLPSDYSTSAATPYPLCVRIGGFHTRYTAAQRGRPYSGIVQVMLDGDGPFGDSYSTNSAVSGPYGDATITELIPAIEKRFHCGGAANRRFTTGGSTGGWVSLALQVYYPDTFGGCWSGYPDSLDFKTYQNIDLYTEANAYLAPDGSERVSARDAFTGTAKWTVREECALEGVRGFNGSYVTSGGQWGAWNAVYGTPDKNGRPVAFWDPVSGKIDHDAANKAGKKYDLRRYCAANWKMLAPKLDNKLHIWVGERDDYFLNGGVHRFDDFLKSASPPITARVEFSPIAGHGWEPRSRSAVLDEMLAASKR